MAFEGINSICFEWLGYALSYLELLAVITGLIAVALASRGKVANFYIGLINNVLYFLLFYQYQLYSMMLLQVIYFCISSYGIYSWTKPYKGQKKLKISTLTARQRLFSIGAIVGLGLIWGWAIIRLSALLPENIEQPAYPYIDALLTMASICGQLLLTRKKIDNWLLWIIVNTCSIVLYSVVGIYFTALLYVIYLGIAIQAYQLWGKEIKQQGYNN